MGNSPLVDYVKLSPNKSSRNGHQIDTITIHCVVGQCTVETLGEIFAPPTKQVSANYGIGPDGRVGLYVDESERSWCSSNRDNDERAITIECASDTKHPYAINDEVYKKLVLLCADICKRNEIPELKWKADKNLIGVPEEQNMTVHRWFANKSCPGDYIYDRLGNIAEEVNAILGNEPQKKPVKEPVKKSFNQKVRIDITYLRIRTGPGINYDATGLYTGKGIFTIVEIRHGGGSSRGWGKLKSGAGWISLDYAENVD